MTDATVMPSKIERWPIDRLVPYECNARTHSPEQVAQIAASIQEFGFTNPILVDGKDEIIAGHGRLAAAKDLGLAQVQQEIAALSLVDFDLSLMGWSEDELAGLLDPEGIDESAKEYEGSQEYGEDEFSEFEHKCPRCGFEFNGKG